MGSPRSSSSTAPRRAPWWGSSCSSTSPRPAAPQRPPSPPLRARWLPSPDQASAGWRVHPDHEGCGYVAEAARAVLAAAFDGGLDRVVAVTHPDNATSQRVAERIGMRRLGATRAYYDEECELFEARR
ncbi:Acetyltransferase (GNAT) domain-containing protein [Austwickia chelonae]|nr:Acetyltransferase (GNAT) domain-containing protein [Austwickia chelonae]